MADTGTVRMPRPAAAGRGRRTAGAVSRPAKAAQAGPAELSSPVDKQGLAAAVADRIRAAILSGSLPIGARVHEVELAERLNVSRGPVRDAIALLRHEGLLEVRWHKGAFVRQLNAGDADEIYSLRSSIESLAVERAITHGTADDHRRLFEAAQAIERAAAEGSQHDMLEADISFHEAIYRAAHHERLLQTWMGLRSQISLMLLSRQGADPHYRSQIPEEHHRLYGLILAGDIEAACREIRRHIDDAAARTRRHLSATPVAAR